MKENEDLNLKNILRKRRNSPMKVILNGGKRRLDDATIPFQIGLDQSIIDLNPTHILVIDVTENQYSNSGNTRLYHPSKEERTLFELEPMNYLQLHKPGVHHLIFLLCKGIDKIHHEYLLEKTPYGYSNWLYWDSIESNKAKYQICYYEVIVNVSEEAFAPEPKTKFEKAVYAWTNSWYRTKRIDECHYKKRLFVAFTVKPILWLLGFVLRLIIAPIIQVIVSVARVVTFICGWQPIMFFPNKKMLWFDYLLLYPRAGYEDVFNFKDNWFGDGDKEKDHEFYDFKNIVIFKKRFYTPITVFGLIFHGALFGLYGFIMYRYWGDDNALCTSNILLSLIILLVLSFFITLFMVNVTLPTIKEGDEWNNRWDTFSFRHRLIEKKLYLKRRVGNWMFFSLSGFAVISCVVTQIPWAHIIEKIDFQLIMYTFLAFSSFVILVLLISKLFKFLLSKYEKIISTIEAKNVNVPEKKDLKHQEWLRKSFSINLPKKVDIKTMPKPSNFVHYFRVGFWFAKSKVCKPYARK